MEDEDRVTEPGTPANGGQGTQAGDAASVTRITELSLINDAEDRTALVGKPVELEDVEVRNVNGQRSFWVGPLVGNKLLVVLDEKKMAGAQLDLEEADGVKIVGRLERVPDDPTPHVAHWGLENGELDDLKEDRVYILAEQVTAVDDEAPATP